MGSTLEPREEDNDNEPSDNDGHSSKDSPANPPFASPDGEAAKVEEQDAELGTGEAGVDHDIEAHVHLDKIRGIPAYNGQILPALLSSCQPRPALPRHRTSCSPGCGRAPLSRVSQEPGNVPNELTNEDDDGTGAVCDLGFPSVLG